MGRIVFKSCVFLLLTIIFSTVRSTYGLCKQMCVWGSVANMFSSAYAKEQAEETEEEDKHGEQEEEVWR